jgi:lipopolysaccharide transport system permease protein
MTSAAVGALRLSRTLVHKRDLLANLVVREFRARYMDSALGLLWAVVSPLLQLAIYSFVFQRVLDLGVRRYSSFVFIGIVAWAWFATTINASTRILKTNRNMVEQPGFPAPVLPLVSTTTSMIDFLIALPILSIIIAIEGYRVNAAVLALPAVMLVQFGFTLGLGLILAGLNAALRDVQHIVLLTLQLYLFATPIFYDLDSVPAAYQRYFTLNPMTHLVEAYRAILMDGRLPDPAPLLVVAALSTVLVVAGLRIFRWARYRYLEEL